jgi:cobalt/nickel transport system ATP-binding protein
MDFVWSVCERAVILDAARVVADGPVKQLLTDKDLLEQHGLELPSQVASRQ